MQWQDLAERERKSETVQQADGGGDEKGRCGGSLQQHDQAAPAVPSVVSVIEAPAVG